MTKLIVLHVPDCASLPMLRERLDIALAERHDVFVDLRVVDNQDAAEAEGMAGSPTLLIDGVDPFAAPGQSPSVSCRLYREETGHLAGAPSVTQLREALTGGRSKATALVTPASTPGGDCCVPSSSGLPGLLAARRTAAGAPADRAVHQAILLTFADTGQPPTVTALQTIAAEHGTHAATVLARLHAADVIGLDSTGEVAVAYPFSTAATRHQVTFPSGVTVSAMCAVDALGLPAMLNSDGVVKSADPLTGERLTVIVRGDQYAWEPDTAVVFLTTNASDGSLSETHCGDLNFFATRDNAEEWMSTHPEVSGTVLTGGDAVTLGRTLFGDILTDH